MTKEKAEDRDTVTGQLVWWLGAGLSCRWFWFFPVCLSSAWKTQGIYTLLLGPDPHTAKSRADADKLRAQTLNARSETVFEKPSFRSSIMHQRCLVIVMDFWMDDFRKEIPALYLYGRPWRILFGGIYASWTGQRNRWGSFIPFNTNNWCQPDAGQIHTPNSACRWSFRLVLINAGWTSEPVRMIRRYFHPYPLTTTCRTIPSVKGSHPDRNSNAPKTLEPVTYPELHLPEEMLWKTYRTRFSFNNRNTVISYPCIQINYSCLNENRFSEIITGFIHRIHRGSFCRSLNVPDWTFTSACAVHPFPISSLQKISPVP